MYDIEQLRRTEFPLSNTEIFFNHASASPIPQRTKRRIQWAVERLAEQPARFLRDEFMPLSEQLQSDLADYLNAAGPHEITYVTSTSFGINSLAQAFPWRRGDNMLFCECEFPSNAYPWMLLDSKGVESRKVPAVDGGLTLDALLPLVDERTRLITVSAIQFFSGHRSDLAAIGAFCHEHDIYFVVDAIQAIGHMAIDVQHMHIDALVTGGQKSIMCVPGVGFMYVRDGLCCTMEPAWIGANATHDFLHWLHYDMTPAADASRFRMGTTNDAGITGLAASLSLLEELGVENIDRHTSQLAAYAMQGLARLGYEVLTPPHAHGPIVTFASGLDAAATNELVDYLARRHVTVVKHLDAAGKPHVRFSFHCYNTIEEIDCALGILREAQGEGVA